MRKKLFYKLLKYGIVLFLFVGVSLSAAVLDWDAEQWSPDGALSQEYTDVDGSGVDINVSMTDDTNRFINSTPNDDTNSLTLQVNFRSKTEKITTTITFSKPVILKDLVFRDIDSGSFNDKVIITAVDIDGNTIAPNNVRIGNEVVALSTTEYESSGNGTLANDDPDGFITFDFSSAYITEMSFVYTSGSTADNNPGSQYLWFNNVIFEPLSTATLIDTDGDGVSDGIDIDDDNDGILDINEGKLISESNTSSGTIPDDGSPTDCLDRTITIAENGTIVNTTIAIDIEHTWRGDLIIELISPSGTAIDLIRNQGGSADNLSVTFDDSDSINIAGDTTDFTLGTYEPRIPENFLSTFNDEDAEGIWTLHICDSAAYDVGIFYNADLKIFVEDDRDGDGIVNHLDLDSDNDGIPDNIEAQSTSGYISPSNPFTDADGDGLDDNYDNNTSASYNSIGLVAPDTDGDGITDIFDLDSDNDGYTDCEEGLDPNSFNVSCPVNAADVGTNGLVDWADNGDDYSDVSGAVITPSSDLYNETGDNSEVGYREFLCGKGRIYLTAYNWRLISLPCKTNTHTVAEVFSQLGTYGDNANFVMYEQTGNDNYEVNATYPNTEKRMLTETDTLEQGKSYWIITDADHNVTIPRDLPNLEPTNPLVDSSAFNPNATESFTYDLPTNSAENAKKFMAGNPFPYSFRLVDLYFEQAAVVGPVSMADTAVSSYINQVVYIHDAPDTGPSIGYEALDASTPGFEGSIGSMEGFFIKLEKSSNDTYLNRFYYPLIQRNGGD